MEAELFSWVANPGGEDLADHQTRQAGSIFCYFQWPRPGISEGNARKPTIVSYGVHWPEEKGTSFVS